ncbi:MAG: type II toxin-antitoxin system RelE/ParE family toxin [Alphaproteobacteria bacterium]|nr:type II toxin-antitoxin system RelE/ParE family toxin [Alphaproteobacteria bacterium]
MSWCTRLRYSRGALADLDDIFRYIARDHPAAAARLVARIEQVANLTAHHPHIGVIVRKPGLRRFPVGKYLIIYEVAADEVIIQYVRHGARRPPWRDQ